MFIVSVSFIAYKNFNKKVFQINFFRKQAAHSKTSAYKACHTNVVLSHGSFKAVVTYACTCTCTMKRIMEHMKFYLDLGNRHF